MDKTSINIELDKDIISKIDEKVDGKKFRSREQAAQVLLGRALGNNRSKKAIFLLGGKGTRLRPYTYEIPKALVPFQGRTVPEHLIDLFKKFGTREFIFSVGYKADQIREYFGDGSRYGVKIIYVEEKEAMGSAGAIKLARDYFNGTFVVTNGDELKDIDLEELYMTHKENKSLVTVALTSVEDPSAYGVARLEGSRIREFVEKPPVDEAPSSYINSGLSIWEPEVIDLIPEGFSMYEEDIFPILARNGKLYAYTFDGQWFDTGTPERYERALKHWQGIAVA